MGLTFKENCTDLRNSGVMTVVKELVKQKCKVDLYDPWADSEQIKKIYGISPKSILTQNTYDGILIAVAHDKFKIMGINTILKFSKKKSIIYDLKYLFSKDQVDLRL